MTALVNLAALRALRAKMTPGEWSARRHGSMGPRDFVLQMGNDSDNYEIIDEDNAAGIVATHAAADTLIEIAEAALAWRDTLGSPRGDRSADNAEAALLAALAKVSR